MKPVVGITPSVQIDTLAHGTFRRLVTSAAYARAVAAAGGIPLILPPQSDIPALLEILDGVLLSGGPDLDPDRYGDRTVHAETYGIDAERDQFELDLFDAALRNDTPVLGICRGIQVINVALGGTLIQDVPSEHPGASEVGHRQHDRGLESSAVGHEIAVSEPNLLPIFESSHPGVNSFHHQAIRDLAPGLVAVAHSPDGLVEAVAMPSQPAVFGVQWHPELMFERHLTHLAPFRRLVEMAVSRRAAPALA
jgi:putative glutamine amidotransferase